MQIRKSDNREEKFLDEKLIGSFCRLGVPKNEACVMVDSIKRIKTISEHLGCFQIRVKKII